MLSYSENKEIVIYLGGGGMHYYTTLYLLQAGL